MNASEQLKLDLITKVKSGLVSKKNAQKILNLSESTIDRYLRQLRENGAMFVKHGNCNKKPVNSMCSNVEAKILKLCVEKYYDFNRRHACEEIARNEKIIIKQTTFNNFCRRHNLLSKNIKRRKKISRHRRERMRQMGLMVQMDGSPHKWFGGKMTCLVIAIDDATSDILYGEFSRTETTFACMNVTKEVLKNYGLFQILYTDRAGIFGNNAAVKIDAVKREGFSCLKKCLNRLSIQVLNAYSAEAKGRVERAFKTLQDRLVPEMRLAGVTNIQEANHYLNKIYLQKHRENFVIEAMEKNSAFIKLHPTVNLEENFYMWINRLIKNDHTFQINGKIYDLENGEINLSGKEVQIRTYPNSKVRYFVDDKEVKIKDANNMAA